jgi:hypothetical protein
MQTIEHIDREAAEQYLKNNRQFTLRYAKSMDDDAAAILAKNSGPLELDSLTSLTKAAATSLGHYEGFGYLGLDGLNELPADVAKELSRSSGDLYLNGISNLSVTSARNLSRHKHALYLYGIKNLSLSVSVVLAKHKGTDIFGGLHLGGLTRLSKEITEKEVSVLNVACSIPRKIPTDKQATVLVKAEQRAVEEGFFSID